MRVVVQRVAEAWVAVEGKRISEIGPGLAVLAGFEPGDGREVLDWMAAKLAGLRIFPDEEGRMNRDVADIGGEMLIVSQFTLLGDVSRGRRPSFTAAAAPEEARLLYAAFVDVCRGGVVPIAAGEFGAHMELALVNDGPVTLVIDR